MASAAARRLYLLGSVTIVAALLGYIGLARFMSIQMVFTGAILATMYIGFLSARAVSEEGAFARTAVGRRLERSFKLDPDDARPARRWWSASASICWWR